MKSWAARHPNVMVVLYMLLTVCFAIWFENNRVERDWFGMVCDVVGFCIAVEHTARWYHRT